MLLNCRFVELAVFVGLWGEALKREVGAHGKRTAFGDLQHQESALKFHGLSLFFKIELKVPEGTRRFF